MKLLDYIANQQRTSPYSTLLTAHDNLKKTDFDTNINMCPHLLWKVHYCSLICCEACEDWKESKPTCHQLNYKEVVKVDIVLT